jgi:competence protein ComFC
MLNRLSFLIDLLYSEKCSLCGDYLTPDRKWPYPLCALCGNTLPVRQGPFCSVCSTELVSEKDTCLRCRVREYSFESNQSLFLYGDDIKELLKQFKSKNTKSLSVFFARLMGPIIQKSYTGFTIVPVPFRSSRKRQRGWDQIEEICKQLKRIYDQKSRRMLKRKNTSAQKTLSLAGRMANLEGNISVYTQKLIPPKVLLIDDVFTTGATANACAAALKNAGVAEVRMLSIALDQ